MYWTTRWPHRAWNPLLEIEAARERMNRLLSLVPASIAAPPAAMWANDDGLRLSALVPGVLQEDIELSVVGDVLTLAVRRAGAAGANDAAWRLRERMHAGFTRTFRLPYQIDAQRVQARLVNGRLDIELPRAAEDKPRRIAVQAD